MAGHKYKVGDVVWVDWGYKWIRELRGGYVGPAKITEVIKQEKWLISENPEYYIRLPLAAARHEFIAYHKSLDKIE